jgi:hypothetical protein
MLAFSDLITDAMVRHNYQRRYYIPIADFLRT